MKKYLFFTLMAAIVALFSTFGCKKSTSPGEGDLHVLGSPDTIFVKMGETAQIFAGDFSIRLDSVLSDSRCPANVVCVWEGRVESRFVFTQNGSSVSDTLSNDPIGSVYWPDDKTKQLGFNIRLLEMAPYPQDPTPSIPQADYVAKLLVLPE